MFLTECREITINYTNFVLNIFFVTQGIIISNINNGSNNYKFNKTFNKSQWFIFYSTLVGSGCQTVTPFSSRNHSKLRTSSNLRLEQNLIINSAEHHTQRLWQSVWQLRNTPCNLSATSSAASLVFLRAWLEENCLETPSSSWSANK